MPWKAKYGGYARILCLAARNTASAVEFTALQAEIWRLRSNSLPCRPKYGGFARIYCLTARNTASALEFCALQHIRRLRSNNWLAETLLGCFRTNWIVSTF
ncbi:hypothetical protein ACQKML_23460 [Peribacillus frigoritolerans]